MKPVFADHRRSFALAALGIALLIAAEARGQHIPPPISHGPFRNQLDPYRARAAHADDHGRPPIISSAAVERGSAVETSAPTGDLWMWWQQTMTSPLGLETDSIPVNLAELTQAALVASPYVKSVLTEPQIRCDDLVIADAAFDTLAFVETKFGKINEPVGSELTTGDNSTRYRDETFYSSAGLRKKARSGGSLEVVQRGGYQANNSTFLIPNPQGTTRLEINFTQPLLKDHGRAVNNTLVLLAQIDVQLANSEVRGDLQDHLIDVSAAYWDLFEARAEWMQRNRLLEGATKLHAILQARQNVDSQQRQILRAQVAVTRRRSDLIRAETRIRNAQARLRLLTGDPKLTQLSRYEWLPQDQPLGLPVDVSIRQATLTALDNRPDIAQAIRTIQAVSARVGAAKNQVLPRLDLILSSYVAGLEAGRDSFGAFINQFDTGTASFAAGLQFEIPVGNRASRARLARSRWELSRAVYQFQQRTELAFTEVEISVRETRTAFDEMQAKQQSIEAANREVDYLQQRWELLPDPNESAVLLIDDLLDAQDRLANEERSYVRAQVSYAMSWVQLRKAMGVLLQLDDSHGGGIAGSDLIVSESNEFSGPIVDPGIVPEAENFDQPPILNSSASEAR